MEDMNSQVWLELNTRWFNLPNYTQLYQEVYNFLSNTLQPAYGIKTYNFDGTLNVMDENKKYEYITPIIFDREYDNRMKVNDIYVAPNYNMWKEWQNHAIAIPNQHF